MPASTQHYPRNVQQLQIFPNQNREAQRTSETYVSIYGTIDTAKQANAAQVKNSPGPADTIIIGMADPLKVTVLPLTASVFLIITVHRAAPTKSRKLPRIARVEEMKNATVCFITPLTKDF